MDYKFKLHIKPQIFYYPHLKSKNKHWKFIFKSYFNPAYKNIIISICDQYVITHCWHTDKAVLVFMTKYVPFEDSAYLGM